MKKLAITSVAVLIALIGFTAALYMIPCGDCCGQQEGCEMHDAKSSCDKSHGDKSPCDKSSGDKCSGMKQGCGSGHGHHKGGHGCGKGQGGHDGCGGGNEKCMVKEWKDADGKVHKEVKVIVGGEGHCGMEMSSGCPMDNGAHGGCCGCCPMKNGGGKENCCGDSVGSDSVRVKVRGKL
jgi:hypothetical protein